MATITLYLDIISTPTYLLTVLLHTTPFSSIIPVTIIPVSLRHIMTTTSNPNPLEIPKKGLYIRADFNRTALRYSIPLRPELPEGFPLDCVFAQRLLCTLQSFPDELRMVAMALQRALWVDRKEVQVEEVVVEVVASVIGMERAKEAVAKAKTAEIKEILKTNCKEAVEKGAFGLPWVVVHREGRMDEVVWGCDRMDLIAEMCGVAWPPQGIGAAARL